MSNSSDIIYRYWGKARPDDDTGLEYHLLPYHCLDVAAVASVWWKNSIPLRRQFCSVLNLSEKKACAWIIFFICLHDLGKFDVRFQMKSPELGRILLSLHKDEKPDTKYDHGSMGFVWFVQEIIEMAGIDQKRLKRKNLRYLFSWMQLVAGHHGRIPSDSEPSPPSFVSSETRLQDHEARRVWIDVAKNLFLQPEDLTLSDIPLKVPEILTGFCSVSDWIGSNTDFFKYNDKGPLTVDDLQTYFDNRMGSAKEAIEKFGVVSHTKSIGGMSVLFPTFTPFDLQRLVEEFPLKNGLTLIEAPTGSGKTETALAYASRLIAKGLADSIIFALPTQATANAMLERLEDVADKFFTDGKNVVLAHGKSRFVREFVDLKKAAKKNSVQGSEEALVQCSEWLATSRKRVFLGQIGVCTIDQVLLSVLPVRHNFVRSFGIQKSILIIDEVHAYDSYMYGLLHRVLKAQHESNGSVTLLSATLPTFQRKQLLKAWNKEQENIPLSYPLVAHTSATKTNYFTIPEGQEIPDRKVEVDLWPSAQLQLTQKHLQNIAHKAEQGGMIAVICNLVADAQAAAKELKQLTDIPVDLFHSRFRFIDRQGKERFVLSSYGKKAQRTNRILVATQVVEQSLDLDFDWLVTQLCPADLLFQRLGRLHRHKKNHHMRPAVMESPKCSIVILPEGDLDYGGHGIIYQNLRSLWRTQQKLTIDHMLTFPAAYREWIEDVYQEEPWQEEPKKIIASFKSYIEEQEGRRYAALLNASIDAVPFSDTDGNVALLTRDSEMNLNLIPIIRLDNRRYFLGGQPLDSLEDWQRWEALNQNMIGVPNSWQKILPKPEEDGVIYLEMVENENEWIANTGSGHLAYTKERGLEIIEQ